MILNIFQFQLNEGVELPNNNLIAIEEKENGFVDMAQRYNLTIDPKNHGKTLVCTFTQVWNENTRCPQKTDIFGTPCR